MFVAQGCKPCVARMQLVLVLLMVQLAAGRVRCFSLCGWGPPLLVQHEVCRGYATKLCVCGLCSRVSSVCVLCSYSCSCSGALQAKRSAGTGAVCWVLEPESPYTPHHLPPTLVLSVCTKHIAAFVLCNSDSNQACARVDINVRKVWPH